MTFRLPMLAFLLAFLVGPGLVQAGPALLFDPSKGTILYEEDMDALWHPASLTKLMTAYITFEALRDGKITMDSVLTCSETANAQPPSKIGLPVGGEMSVSLALRSLIVKSANDVAFMLAEKISGSGDAFIGRMNATAKRLGMTRTVFTNPNGLPDEKQVTTARDMGLLARAIINEFPDRMDLFSEPYVKVGKVRMRTHNRLLQQFEGADGLKTGFICDSGYNIVASATRDGRRLVAVVLGGESGTKRNERAASLLDQGFRRYKWKALFGDDIDRHAINASAADAPESMRPVVCKVRKRVIKKRTKKK
ncbi:MAG: D-alanyl-D-alanine carboxypeptidase family protein [Pseudomonadota bacterium]|nr:D-alanyl-D-alanine carboxypeptidase family protein [Pseudomonadota bacterium]